MFENIKKLWVKALRSGRFKKADGMLRDDSYNPDESKEDYEGSYCTLGVLNKVYEEETGEKLSTRAWDESDLTPKVRDWAGLNDRDPMLTRDREVSMVNDDGDKSFKQIANLIEKKF